MPRPFDGLLFPKPLRAAKKATPRKVWQRAAADKVQPEVRQAVFRRDGWCVASFLDTREHSLRTGTTCGGADPCSWWGRALTYGSLIDLQRMTLDHVHEGYGRMGVRADSDAWDLATVCRHHALDGWATSHKDMLRAYLAPFKPREDRNEANPR